MKALTPTPGASGTSGASAEQLLGTLAITRPVFYSEADFQHALAWELHAAHPALRVRLERRTPTPHRPEYLDIWAAGSTGSIAVELKYKTRRAKITHDGEEFRLRSHAAQNFNRYDFWKDVTRLERLASSEVGGYAIFLTNDSSYWRAPEREKNTADAAFRIHEGRVVSGPLRWATDTDRGSRNASLRLTGEYRLRWADFSAFPSTRNGTFRYLILRISGGASNGRTGAVRGRSSLSEERP